MLKLLGLWVFAILFEVPALILTVLANVVTIPLGFGIAVLYPGEKFLKHPFQVSGGGKQVNLAWFLIPFWILVVNVWFMAFGHIENIVSVIMWLWSIVLLICYIHAINFAKKGELIVEFVEPKEETNQSPA
jgi:hypothetical protein